MQHPHVTQGGSDRKNTCDDAPDPIQLECWKKMGAVRRSALALQLRQEVMRAKQTSLQHQNPHWSVNEVRQTAARYFLHGQS